VREVLKRLASLHVRLAQHRQGTPATPHHRFAQGAPYSPGAFRRPLRCNHPGNHPPWTRRCPTSCAVVAFPGEHLSHSPISAGVPEQPPQLAPNIAYGDGAQTFCSSHEMVSQSSDNTSTPPSRVATWSRIQMTNAFHRPTVHRQQR
jgi:hypothetical protein